MAESSRIPVPWSRRWQRIRFQAAPAVLFVGAMALCAWMWSRQMGMPNAVGEVEAVQFEMASQYDGLLVPLPQRQVDLFEPVRVDDVLAKLDDRPVLASLTTLRSDLVRLGKEVTATDAKIRLTHAHALNELEAETRRIAVELQRQRLDVLDRQAAIETDRIELQRRDEKLDLTRRLHDKGVETDFTLLTEQLRRDVVAQRIKSNEGALVEAQTQVKDSQKRLAARAPLPTTELDSILAPLRAAITAQEARITELQLQAQSLVIRSPIAGMVSAVYRRPGQTVRAGEPIITVADVQSRRIVAYVRQGQGPEPFIGMQVRVRTRTLPVEAADTIVEEVGPQVRSVPSHQLRDPRTPEWGLPIGIAVPSELSLRPGELVDLTFTRGGRPLPDVGARANPSHPDGYTVTWALATPPRNIPRNTPRTAFRATLRSPNADSSAEFDLQPHSGNNIATRPTNVPAGGGTLESRGRPTDG